MFLRKAVLFIFCFYSACLLAQVPYGHEQAIYKDSSIFVSWASACTVNRGLQNIADSSLGYATAGDSSFAIGKSDGSGVVSLGDGGSAILTFSKPIINGVGNDFAVFENGFSYGIDTLFFLELAFVEVSSDGQNYFRFPSKSFSQTSSQFGNGDGINPKWLNNLAGRYMMNYGTPFDLDEMKNISGLDVNQITHVKIIDVVGSLNDSFSRKDSHMQKINDPWPTPYPSSGFDLDAVGVIHQFGDNGIDNLIENNQVELYPNPVNPNGKLTIKTNSNKKISRIEIHDLHGVNLLMESLAIDFMTLDLSTFDKGIYFFKITIDDFTTIKKMVIN